MTPELLDLISRDRCMDGGLVPLDEPDPQLDVHDVILGVQATTLAMLFDPTRLRRVLDSEQRAGEPRRGRSRTAPPA